MITVKIENILDDIWIDPDSEDELSDEEYISLVQEDILEFLDGAVWTIERDKPCPTTHLEPTAPAAGSR